MSVAVASIYLLRAERVYDAQTDMLVTPVPRDNNTLVGLGLPRESSDPSRDVETVARLIRTPAVAQIVNRQLGLKQSARALLADIDATPVAQSNIVTITAKANDPELAARIANAFAAASVTYRTQRMHEQLDRAIPTLRRQIQQISLREPASREAALQQLRDLVALRALPDPTLRVETLAEPSTSAISPRPTLSIVAAILAGLIVGSGAVLASQLVDPRLSREDQLRRYRIPVLARIPLEKRRGGGQRGLPLSPEVVSPTTRDAYLLLGAMLSSLEDGGDAQRTVLVTGPTPGDGKTTSSLNLALALAEQDKVLLIEGDARRPMLASALGIRPRVGVIGVLARRLDLARAIISIDRLGPRLRLLLQRPEEAAVSSVMTPASAEWLLEEAKRLAPWVVVDAPPLAIVPDALPLARQVDDVILVVRLGNTRLKDLSELAELLSHQGVTPVGFVVVGGRDQSYSYYGRYGRAPEPASLMPEAEIERYPGSVEVAPTPVPRRPAPAKDTAKATDRLSTRRAPRGQP